MTYQWTLQQLRCIHSMDLSCGMLACWPLHCWHTFRRRVACTNMLSCRFPVQLDCSDETIMLYNLIQLQHFEPAGWVAIFAYIWNTSLVYWVVVAIACKMQLAMAEMYYSTCLQQDIHDHSWVSHTTIKLSDYEYCRIWTFATSVKQPISCHARSTWNSTTLIIVAVDAYPSGRIHQAILWS